MIEFANALDRHPKSRSRGRLGTPAEVVLRLLILKHIRFTPAAISCEKRLACPATRPVELSSADVIQQLTLEGLRDKLDDHRRA